MGRLEVSMGRGWDGEVGMERCGIWKRGGGNEGGWGWDGRW